MLNKKNILYFIQFVAGCLLTFLGMYLIIFPNFQQENLPYNKIEYTLLLLYLPTFIFHIIGYVVLNACQEDSITKRKKNLGIISITLFIGFLVVLGLIYLILKKFPLAFSIYFAFTLLFVGYLIYLTIKTFTDKKFTS